MCVCVLCLYNKGINLTASLSLGKSVAADAVWSLNVCMFDMNMCCFCTYLMISAYG